MIKYRTNNIEKFFKYCQNEFMYGWIDQDGKRHEGVNDGKVYYLQSPKQDCLSCQKRLSANAIEAFLE